MVIKVGKYGKFLACSGFPECRGTKRLVKDVGGYLPWCGSVCWSARAPRDASTAVMERYPICDFMTWDMPVATRASAAGTCSARAASRIALRGLRFEMPVPKSD